MRRAHSSMRSEWVHCVNPPLPGDVVRWTLGERSARAIGSSSPTRARLEWGSSAVRARHHRHELCRQWRGRCLTTRSPCDSLFSSICDGLVSHLSCVSTSLKSMVGREAYRWGPTSKGFLLVRCRLGVSNRPRLKYIAPAALKSTIPPPCMW